MTPDVRRAYDEATVILLRATSSREALERVDDEEHLGVPAYDEPGRLTWAHRVCALPECLVAFVPPRTGMKQKYCCQRHMTRAAGRAFLERTQRYGGSRTGRRAAAALAVVRVRAEVA